MTDVPTPAQAEKAALFFDMLQEAREAGKGWWSSSQMRQIDVAIEQDKKIAALTDLAGTVAEYLDMPCDSLRHRMRQALTCAQAVL
ncbi:hypothetical protein [Mesorhizobium ventifaucium]|uniref:Uncharacterized protein n=1 Tax=Mesorhizobium ventifaucium TaxID=666020 RepID=A0ABN8JNA5_9HYPH|nr:hypothetical protein [Mesorhizobium ventifaucium]CAH2399114.1 hypothetical protein MES4922_210103 [Mesorhizobium ventifaucium]